MNTRIKQDIIAAAQATPDVEVCGLIYQTNEGVGVYPCPNVTRDEEGAAAAFEIDPQDYITAAQLGRVIGVYHSHTAHGTTAFSEEDLDRANTLELPFYLYANKDESWHYYVPPGYQVPLTGVTFSWGTADCYETVRIYYRQARQIYLGDYDRDESFENSAEPSAITQYIAAEGFAAVPGNGPLHVGDVLLFRTPGYAYPHHLGVFMGKSQVLHHPLRELSRIDPINGTWLKRLDSVLRYQGRVAV